MQIKTIAAVTNGSQRVTAAIGVDWSQAVVNGVFSLDPGLGTALTYVIGVLYAPHASGNTSTGGNQWQIDLTGNYLAATNAAIATLIHKDFYANGTPIWNNGDRNFFAIQNRANAALDALIGTVSAGSAFSNARPSPGAGGTFQIFNPDQSLWFTLKIRGAAGAETIEIAASGEA